MTELAATIWFYPLRRGETLSGHDWMPFYINRFLASRFVAHALAENRRADVCNAMLLWCEAMKQDPAGTLPDDDVELARLAGFGPDVAGWKAARAGALYGWEPVEIEDATERDGRRLGHPVIAQICSDMFKRKVGREKGREAGRRAVLKSRVKKQMVLMGQTRMAETEAVLDAVVEHLDSNGLFVTRDNVRLAMEVAGGFPRVVAK